MSNPKASNNLANNLVCNDQAKNIMSKTGGKKFKPLDNKLLPKSAHSCFGDFPDSHLPKKNSDVPAPQPLAAAEQSAAAASNTKGKYRSISQLVRQTNRLSSYQISSE